LNLNKIKFKKRKKRDNTNYQYQEFKRRWYYKPCRYKSIREYYKQLYTHKFDNLFELNNSLKSTNYHTSPT